MRKIKAKLKELETHKSKRVRLMVARASDVIDTLDAMERRKISMTYDSKLLEICITTEYKGRTIVYEINDCGVNKWRLV